MPIPPYFDGHRFDPETTRVMVALEMARVALRFEDRTDPIRQIPAKRIIALAKDGLRDPNLLCERWTIYTGSRRACRPPQSAERSAALSVRPTLGERATVMTKVEEYRARAQECELRANQVHDREARQWFLELARQWHHMADQWADLLAERGR
jgi:hypothetical protein